MGAGNISNRFCDAVRRVEDCEVAAVASRSLERAKDFAGRHHLPAAYGNYPEMLEKEKPDCVYIGVLPCAHYDLTMLCLDYGVPVLCEKAMFLNGHQAEAAFLRAEEKNVFVMEALWSRFLPAVNTAKRWLREGRIGRVAYCDTRIGFVPPADKMNRYHNAELGGGAARDILVYAYEITTYLLPDPILDTQVSVVWEDTGVDLTEHVILRYSDWIASLTASFAADLDDRIVLYGERGKIDIPSPHFAKEAFLYDDNGNCVEHFRDEETENGFVYEVQETAACIRAGKIESRIVPHSATLDCARLFDQIDARKEFSQK